MKLSITQDGLTGTSSWKWFTGKTGIIICSIRNDWKPYPKTLTHNMYKEIMELLV